MERAPLLDRGHAVLKLDIALGVLSVNPYSAHVVARLLDFFGDNTLWQRRLWGVGIRLVLHEILEAAQAVRSGVLSAGALKNLCEDALRLAEPDPACKDLMKTLGPLLRNLGGNEDKPRLAPQGHRYELIRQISQVVEKDYLQVWAQVVESPQRPKPERTARAIAAHLLDAGFNPQFLHRRWTYFVHHDPAPRTLGNILEDFNTLVQAAPQEYRVLVALRARPRMHSSNSTPNWKSAGWVRDWIKSNMRKEAPRQYGGLLFTVHARDPWSSVEQVAEILDQLAARFAVGTGVRLEPCESAWVMRERLELPLRRARRGVEIGALDRNGKLFERSPTNMVDAAIELLAPLDDGAPGPAAAGAWSAIEALLSAVDDADNVASGDRLAALIACSFPRAELTRLAYAYCEGSQDTLASSLTAAGSNRERAQLMEAALQPGAQLSFRHPSDQAALTRVSEVLAEPHKKLQDIEAHARSALRRLYRQRNLVLHGGELEAVALRASLRTVAPLVGAGMDRIAHGTFVQHLEPMTLAAKARLQLDLLATPQARAISSLLE